MAAGLGSVLLAVDQRGIARVTLNRSAVGNAYDGAMRAALQEGLAAFREKRRPAWFPAKP